MGPSSAEVDSSTAKRALQPILQKEVAQEPAQKKGKGIGKQNFTNQSPKKRVWGSKKWSKEIEMTASTPIKPSGVKSPDKKREEARAAQTQTEADERNEESMKQKLEEHESEIHYILKDAHKMWKNQTWFNHQLIAMQRKEAAQQYIFTGWSEIHEGCTSEDRDRIILWALMQAGVAPFARDISHQTQSDKLSPISIVTFKNSWQRQRLAQFMASITKSNKGITYWNADGEVNSRVQIKGRIQICTYDRVLGLPLKAALEIIDRNGLNKSDLEKNWKFGELRTSGSIILKAKTDVEMGICKVFVRKDLFQCFLNGWTDAWDKVTSAPSARSKARSSGKEEQEERKIRVPYEIKLVQFTEHPEDADMDAQKSTEEKEE